MIHPSHRGTNYFRKPPKKKKKKRKKPKSPVAGAYGVMVLQENGPAATRLIGNDADPYYRGQDVDKVGPDDGGTVGIAGYLAGKRRSDDKYWRNGQDG